MRNRTKKTPNSKGFTIAEMLVATVITSVALVAVYAVFQQAVTVETRVSRALRDRASARSVVDHLAVALEHAINLGELSGTECSGQGESDGVLELTVSGSSYLGPDPVRSSLQRRRYSWTSGSYADGVGITLTLQIQPYAGTKNVTPAGEIAEMQPEQIWPMVAQQVIARRISSISLMSRPIKGGGDWEPAWKKPAGEVVIRIRVGVGDQMVERVVAARVTGKIGGGSGGQT